ncbi:neuronal-specific septin-3-like isoform X3 [Apostichopus japonicus]|uniref:neuronal-specific septin-3-like isoform X3 n=1 Tax=Stichopus japonicus TaxID=307972 RepID=UPI003AB7F31D
MERTIITCSVALQEAFRTVDVERSGTIETEHLPGLVGKLLRKDASNNNNNVVWQRRNSQNTLKNGPVNFTDFVKIMSETLAESNDWGSLKTDVEGYVGIDSIQDQIRKKALKRGFEFNIMVVGPSGLGKSTLVNSLFRAKVSRRACSTEDSQADAPPIPQSVQVKSVSHVIEESGVRLKLTVTDTPGFGDHINNENCWIPIIEYINEQYEKYLSEEISITRKKHIPDSRVHVCLYFVAPTGHNLKPLDIEVMKRLDKVCNVMPVISKADTLTIEERATFKNRIKEELKKHGVQTYPMKGVNEDADDAKINDVLRDQIPFAVVGSDKTHEIDGKKVLGRLTNWGLIEVENPKHCEFSHLRNMLIRTHMQDLKEVTDSIHYENFRRERLAAKQKFEKAEESRC